MSQGGVKVVARLGHQRSGAFDRSTSSTAYMTTGQGDQRPSITDNADSLLLEAAAELGVDDGGAAARPNAQDQSPAPQRHVASLAPRSRISGVLPTVPANPSRTESTQLGAVESGRARQGASDSKRGAAALSRLPNIVAPQRQKKNVDVPNSVYVVPIAGNGPADVIYDNPTASHETKRPSALIAETSFHTTTPGPVSCPIPRMRSDKERPSTAFEESEFQIDASTGGVHAKSVRRQNPLRQESSTSTGSVVSFSGRVIDAAGLTGMPTRGIPGQPMEPGNVDAADPNDGYIDTVPGPSAYNMPYNTSTLRRHSDI